MPHLHLFDYDETDLSEEERRQLPDFQLIEQIYETLIFRVSHQHTNLTIRVNSYANHGSVTLEIMTSYPQYHSEWLLTLVLKDGTLKFKYTGYPKIINLCDPMVTINSIVNEILDSIDTLRIM